MYVGRLAQGLTTAVTLMVVVTGAGQATVTFSTSVNVTAIPSNDTVAFLTTVSNNTLSTLAQTGNALQTCHYINTFTNQLGSVPSLSNALSALQSLTATHQSTVLSVIDAVPFSTAAHAVTTLSSISTMVTPLLVSQSVLNVLPKLKSSSDLTTAAAAASTFSSGVGSASTTSLAIFPQTAFTSIVSYSMQASINALYQQAGANQAPSLSRRLLSADDDGVDLRLLMTYLLSNISAQCDRLSIRGGLLVAGQTVNVSVSALSVLVGRAAVTDATTVTFSSGDSSSVLFPAQSMAGAVAVDGSSTLGSTDSAVLDSRVYYMPTSLYFWAANMSAPLSSVLLFQRTTTGAVALTPQPAMTVTAVLSLPVTTSTNCSLPTCRPTCALWDDVNALWTLNSTVSSSAVYRNAAGQQLVDCSVRSLTGASVAVFAVNGSYTSCAATSSCSSPSSSSLSAAPPSSSSSEGLSASPTAAYIALSSSASSSTPVYAAGSVKVRFIVDVDPTANVSVLVPELRADIAHNLGGFFGLNDTAFLPYVLIVSFNGNDITVTTPAMRRLLSTAPAPVVFVLLSTVSALSTSSAPINVSAAVSNFVQAANHSLLSTPNSGLTIPAQKATVSDANAAPIASSSGLVSVPPSDSSSSSLAVPLGLALGLGLGLPLLIILLCSAYRQVVAARKRMQLPVSPVAQQRTVASPKEEAVVAVRDKGTQPPNPTGQLEGPVHSQC